ncbi:MAG: O-acetyl-ADP-ribose deacetylase [bacterium]|nr:O-acetyl-ADP-ribose deacetylase [bacterium]
MAGVDRIEILQGDITKDDSDAVVNAANSTLLGGGGVDGAIHRAGGPAILEDCRKLNGCATGDAKITSGGNLPARHVIHTVGPVYSDGSRGEPELLMSCYRRSLEVAVENGVRTAAFPAISCGVYGYPIPEAARIAVQTVAGFLDTCEAIERIRFVLFTLDVRDVFADALDAESED